MTDASAPPDPASPQHAPRVRTARTARPNVARALGGTLGPRVVRTARRTFAALALTALLLTIALVVPGLPAARAAGDPDDDVVRELVVELAVQPDGSVDVSETYTWDFGERDGLGLSRELLQQAAWPADPGTMRVYEYSDVAVSSPSGAPAEVWVTGDGRDLELAIGAPDGSSDTRSGVQTYVLRYTIDGALNAIRDSPGPADRDELYWNVTGSGWRNPIEQLTTTVTGPAAVVDAACYQGVTGSEDECATLDVGATSVTARSVSLAPREQQTIMAAFPAGTFADIAPILAEDPAAARRGAEAADREREDGRIAQRRDTIAAVTDPVAGVVTASPAASVALGMAALGALGWRRARKGRDEHFVGVPPGTVPPAGAAVSTAVLDAEPTETVRFTPPDDLHPAEVGVLIDERVDDAHVSATIVDLAARGHLTLTEAGTNWRGVADDWLMTTTPASVPTDDPPLRPYERLLLESLFRRGRQVRLKELRNTFAGDLARVRRQLASEIDDRGLFRDRLASRGRTRRLPQMVVVALAAFGTVLILGSGGSLRVLPASVFVLLFVAVLVLLALALVRALTAKAARGRTATGRALYDQARGFRLYVATAEAEQVRFEEGVDVFSRYLPYALVFGEADRWSTIFAELAAGGRSVPAPAWYVGRHGTLDSRSIGAIGGAVRGFSAASTSTLGSTPGSSGASGSRSSGGGFSGGGGGGGGGGGR